MTVREIGRIGRHILECAGVVFFSSSSRETYEEVEREEKNLLALASLRGPAPGSR